MKNIFLTAFIAFMSFYTVAQTTDKKLEKILRKTISGYNGNIGIYVKNLHTGKVAAINADTIFPTASIVKVPIMIGIMDKLEKKELDYNQLFTYKNSLLYEGEDILGSYKQDEKIALKKLLMLMLTTSDNTASLWLQSLAGTGTRINYILDSLGFVHTRVNSRTTGRGANRTQYGWGQTTPAEIAKLFEMICSNKTFSKTASDRMMRMLGRNFWDENEAISQIPPYIEVFSKNGCVDASRSEVLYVNAPNHPYVFCIFTKNNKDTSWVHSNEGWTITRKISRLLWNYFEPKDKWEPIITD